MLEDGSVYGGEAAGAFKETVCEIVFNTSMTGYIEILTDPSYAGQGVIMTYPMIGNYGVTEEDFESGKLQPCAFLVHEMCDTPSNFRNEMTLSQLLVKYDMPCMTGLDTRSVVKRLRESGTMRGIITADISNKEALMEKIKAFHHSGLVESVTVDKPVPLSNGSGAKIALMDFGTKRNIGRSLVERGFSFTGVLNIGPQPNVEGAMLIEKMLYLTPDQIDDLNVLEAHGTELIINPAFTTPNLTWANAKLKAGVHS